MKIKSKVSLFLGLVLALNLSLLSSVSFASSAPASKTEKNNVDVHDVVPQEYFDKYKGIYKSKEEVLNAFGLESQSKQSLSAQGVDTAETDKTPALKANTVDEMAAIAAYIYGPPTNESSKDSTIINPNDITEVGEKTDIQGQSITPQATATKKFEVILYELAGGVYTVKGYVDLKYDSSTGFITQTTATSSLIGATAFAIWSPDSPIIDSSAKYKRTITWNGTLTTRLAGEEYWNKRISKTGTFYSGNVIE
ncbi:hypothetical protein ASL14_10400 [Paenibacillus sp. IHB B 3084]|uniref:hypothetical protein n=1 Tax=Paenibacillus sp. IHB B 3084 TaxID=867076 RepID=UPI0007206977|nr:hypothetical protein [Paenibacillus sp. IHB B 3084]ALP36509.1 hypothetical protein ASL14_10400 [Paenibacillus sp. IHB B 3084]